VKPLPAPAAPPALALALGLAALASGAACASPAVKLAGPLGEEGALTWPVTGAAPRAWGAPLALGPWKAAWPADGAPRGWSIEVLGVGGKPAKVRPFAFRLEGPAGAVEVECLQQEMKVLAPFGAALDPEKLGGRATFGCALRPAGARPGDWANAWTLILRARDGMVTAYEGELRNARGVSFSVRSAHAPGNAGPLVGYLLDRAGTPAAAVELPGAGRVTIARREPEVPALAGAAAALLLFEAEP
jgi:hypothetical protein